MIHKLLFAPVMAVIALAKHIEEQAETELYDLGSIQRELGQLYSLYNDAGISDDEFDAEEQKLLNRYKMARQRQEELLQGDNDN